MTLTQQFLIISLFPLSFLGMVVYIWRTGLLRRELLQWWTIVLIAAAVWGSSILRYFGGTTFSINLRYTWGIVGKYALVVTAVALLLTTINRLAVPKQHGRFTFGLSIFLGVAAFLIDYEIWPYQLPPFTVAGSTIRLFDLSMAVWIAAWLVPALAAWILTRQVKTNIPNSRSRNQIQYWLIVLILFMIGAGLSSIQQIRQPVWQEAGLLLIILATLIGTVSFVHSQLPDLEIAIRQLLSRLSGTLIIFGLTWWALTAIVRSVTNLPTDTSPNLVLFLAALFFAGFFTIVYRLVNEITRRLFLPAHGRRDKLIASYQDAVNNLPEPDQLAHVILDVVRVNLGTNDAWFLQVDDGPAGKVALRPLANLASSTVETSSFTGDSPFTAHMRRSRSPLVQYDIDTLSSFDNLLPEEQALLENWRRVLYMPLHAGDNLIAILALGSKTTGESYDRKDFEQLQTISDKFSPLLVQAKNLAGLRQINDHIFTQNQILTHEKQHLHELMAMFAQFNKMVTSDLKRPFNHINRELEKLQTALANNAAGTKTLDTFSQEIHQLENKITRLITIANRLQSREKFQIEVANLDQITQQAIHNLHTMAEARHVAVKYEPPTTTPSVLGDSQQLQEAIQQLLHNAIKYNKIGGEVSLSCAVDGNELYLRMRDTGVGIPEDRLNNIWQGFSFPQNGNGRNAGLGLTLVHHIITAHGGHVEAKSTYGSGSIFSVYLPIAYNT
jgi:two-component system phosphate regulon sensor histidine kinase PhoR